MEDDCIIISPQEPIFYQDGIKIIMEADFEDLILQYRNNEQTAFSHCISADFRMSAGVAVVFREQFGRPSKKLNHYLAYQKIPAGASIYGLITKPMYYNKPSLTDYNMAFEHFEQDFKRRDLKHLICSAMGCNRDGLLPSHFAANIVKFRRNTGAEVLINIYQEHSGRQLRSGSSFDEFKHNLCNAVSHYIQLPVFNMPSTQDFPPLCTNSTEHNNSDTYLSANEDVRECENSQKETTPPHFLVQTTPVRYKQ